MTAVRFQPELIWSATENKNQKSESQTHHPPCCHGDVFTLTCCWGSGTAPPSWSWGHPRSSPRSHREPQIGSPLQENNKEERSVRTLVQMGAAQLNYISASLILIFTQQSALLTESNVWQPFNSRRATCFGGGTTNRGKKCCENSSFSVPNKHTLCQ